MDHSCPKCGKNLNWTFVPEGIARTENGEVEAVPKCPNCGTLLVRIGDGQVEIVTFIYASISAMMGLYSLGRMDYTGILGAFFFLLVTIIFTLRFIRLKNSDKKTWKAYQKAN